MAVGKIKEPAQIKTSSTAEYFAKNLQQVGFSSPTKAVLTTLKEAFDNSLDACEEHNILPTIRVLIERKGKGATKNTDLVLIRVEDNGPGIPVKELPMVFGEYLASSKFGRGRCTRGQQGIGISAATTWAMQTAAQGVKVVTRCKGQKKATSCVIEIDLKNNKGVFKDKQEIDWDRPHGTSVEFLIDGRVQMNGEAGIMAFLKSNVLVNPHLELHYKLMDDDEVHIERVATKVPHIPEATAPHPHTMKLGEFLAHGKLFGKISVREWLLTAFSRVTDQVMQDMVANHGIQKKMLDNPLSDLNEEQRKALFSAIQNASLLPPSTNSVLAIGEAGLAKSILRLGEVDYFSVVSRRPAICDFKPIQVEVAIARLEERGSKAEGEDDEACQVLRFANRVPLQFDKAGCAIVKAITSVNWKVYGMKQARGALPQGPYIIAVSVVSPFIKFKNASKETIDASDELVEEIRRALMQGGQRLSRHLRREHKEALLESKMAHIEQFAPILVDGLVRMTQSNEDRRSAAHKGLLKILGRDTQEAAKELEEAEAQLEVAIKRKKKRLGAAYELTLAKGEKSDLDQDDEDEDESPPTDDRKRGGKRKKSRDAVDEIDTDELSEEVEEKAASGKKSKSKAKAVAKNKAEAARGTAKAIAAEPQPQGKAKAKADKGTGKKTAKPAAKAPAKPAAAKPAAKKSAGKSAAKPAAKKAKPKALKKVPSKGKKK
ncbi:MAG TPA: DNA topoisomerase VI subunit B [Oligoflexus sp.]|uniref:DNA topoisomerase VI subunit B n=1 Tax=Oligoflexus sp. TaxID=1971216 RepID=UPI002D810EA2|nr:DNA topoisomerase VI subunit B [Oligoflexus sp.]HET9241496.1 DNA topoisomerase VI subunit B [Oligoflexus sp.]